MSDLLHIVLPIQLIASIYLCIHSEVKKLVWVVNKGQLLSMCGDDCIYLLDIKQGREIEIVQMIKFNKEIPTSINLAVNLQKGCANARMRVDVADDAAGDDGRHLR